MKGASTMSKLAFYTWYFLTESETFVYILIGAALIMFGMFLERTW